MDLEYKPELEEFIESNEDTLMSIWDEYKFEQLVAGKLQFHYDDVDYWHEGEFVDMCSDLLYDLEKQGDMA